MAGIRETAEQGRFSGNREGRTAMTPQRFSVLFYPPKKVWRKGSEIPPLFLPYMRGCFAKELMLVISKIERMQ
jgi:hypothetical protein